MARKSKATDGPSAGGKAAKPAAKRSTARGSKKKSTVDHEQIAKRAYELYLARGRAEGFAEQDWKQAEKELLS